jgi:hypothetical protein
MVTRLAACVVVSGALAFGALGLLEALMRRPRRRTVARYFVIQVAGTVVLAFAAIVPAMLCVGEAWAVFVSGPILLGPFIAWDVVGVQRLRRARSRVDEPG